MKYGTIVLFLAAVICVTGHAQKPSLERIDWSQASPGALDMAYDWLDAVINSSRAMYDRDEVYLPLSSQADSIMRKLQRKISWHDPDETKADEAIYSAVGDYAFLVSMCRTARRASIPDCSQENLDAREDKSKAALKAIAKLARAKAN